MFPKENLKKAGVTLLVVMVGLALHQIVVAPRIAKMQLKKGTPVKA
jgi:hypothetical protein